MAYFKRAEFWHRTGCLRCLLLVMCTYPFAKKVLTLHLACGEGREHYFGCNLTHRKVLASSHQHLMAEAPRCAQVSLTERYEAVETLSTYGENESFRVCVQIRTVRWKAEGLHT